MATPQTRDHQLIANYITRPDDRREICGALERIGPTHLYRDSSEFSGPSLDPEASAPWKGVHDIPDSALTLVSSQGDRKSTRLNSSHVAISYAVFCLKKKSH